MLGVLQGVLHASSESHCCFVGKKRREKDVSFLGVFLGGVWICCWVFSSATAYLGSCLTEVEAAC